MVIAGWCVGWSVCSATESAEWILSIYYLFYLFLNSYLV